MIQMLCARDVSRTLPSIKTRRRGVLDMVDEENKKGDEFKMTVTSQFETSVRDDDCILLFDRQGIIRN